MEHVQLVSMAINYKVQNVLLVNNKLETLYVNHLKEQSVLNVHLAHILILKEFANYLIHHA
jgi:hypothetical protein